MTASEVEVTPAEREDLAARLEKILVHLRAWPEANLRRLATSAELSRRDRRARGIREPVRELQVWANCALMVLEERRKFTESSVPSRRGEG